MYQVALIGCVIAGLDSVKNIHPDAFEGLSASSIQCLPSNTLVVKKIENFFFVLRETRCIQKIRN